MSRVKGDDLKRIRELFRVLGTRVPGLPMEEEHEAAELEIRAILAEHERKK